MGWEGNNQIIGPQHCSECGEDYGHAEGCSRRHVPLSRKISELAKSPLPDSERLQVLISLTAELAREIE